MKIKKKYIYIYIYLLFFQLIFFFLIWYKLDTSTIIKSNKGDFIFSNCIFQDSVIKSPIPAIADSTDSKITLTNVKISNLK